MAARKQTISPTSVVQTPEGQATLDAIADVQGALAGLNTIISVLDAGGGAFDAATPTQRTNAIKLMAKSLRGIALLLRGRGTPFGDARVPD